MQQSEKRWIDNVDSAKKVSKEFFYDAVLLGCDPSWMFSIPYYLPGTPHRGKTFEIPDYIMGALAERMGLSWKWGEGVWRHPDQVKADYDARLKKDKDSLKEMKKLMKKHGLTDAMKAWEKVERCSQ